MRAFLVKPKKPDLIFLNQRMDLPVIPSKAKSLLVIRNTLLFGYYSESHGTYFPDKHESFYYRDNSSRDDANRVMHVSNLVRTGKLPPVHKSEVTQEQLDSLRQEVQEYRINKDELNIYANNLVDNHGERNAYLLTMRNDMLSFVEEFNNFFDVPEKQRFVLYSPDRFVLGTYIKSHGNLLLEKRDGFYYKNDRVSLKKMGMLAKSPLFSQISTHSVSDEDLRSIERIAEGLSAHTAHIDRIAGQLIASKSSPEPDVDQGSSARESD